MRLHALTRWSCLIVSITLLAPPAFAGEWLAGDLHCHSLHSDGDSSVADVLLRAEINGLDFLALTDHDSYMNGEPTHWHDPGFTSESLILLHGVEWTTDRGHGNVWAAGPFDYAELWQAHKAADAQLAVDAAHRQGALFSINHPLRLNWTYGIPDNIDCIETWNGPMRVNNNFLATHEFWDPALLDGRRITAVGGSDTHHLFSFLAPFTDLGSPTTWVYANERTAEGVLEGIAEGRVTVSFKAGAPRVELVADTDANGRIDAMMGGNLPGTGRLITFTIYIVGGPLGAADAIKFPEGLIHRINREALTFFDYLWLVMAPGRLDPQHDIRLVAVMRNGELFRAWLISGSIAKMTFTDSPSPDERYFYRVETYGDTGMTNVVNQIIYGSRTAMTNPIYVNYE